MPEGDPIEEGSGPPPPPPAPDMSPRVTDQLDWRARALHAEEQIKQLEAQLAQAQAKAGQAESALATAQRQWALERELGAAGVIDAEAGAILAGAAVSSAEGGTPFDPAPVVAELKRRRPYLFAEGAPRASAMSGAIPPASPDTLARAAEEARASGDRGALLKYLRMRRV